MLRMLVRRITVAIVLILGICACGSHVGDAQGVTAPGEAAVRDPENPYWPARPLNFEAVDPAHGPGIR